MDDYHLSPKEKHQLAKEFTVTAIQNGLLDKHSGVYAAKKVTEFYNTLLADLDKPSSPQKPKETNE